MDFVVTAVPVAGWIDQAGRVEDLGSLLRRHVGILHSNAASHHPFLRAGCQMAKPGAKEWIAGVKGRGRLRPDNQVGLRIDLPISTPRLAALMIQTYPGQISEGVVEVLPRPI